MAYSALYEILLVQATTSLTESEWTWRRLESDGSVSARGGRHATMKACYAEAHHHKSAFGDADIRVNLIGDEMPPVTEPATITELRQPIVSTPLKRRLVRGVAGFG